MLTVRRADRLRRLVSLCGALGLVGLEGLVAAVVESWSSSAGVVVMMGAGRAAAGGVFSLAIDEGVTFLADCVDSIEPDPSLLGVKAADL